MDSVFTHCTCYLHVLAANAVIWSSATETEENRYHVRLATDVCVCVLHQHTAISAGWLSARQVGKNVGGSSPTWCEENSFK